MRTALVLGVAAGILLVGVLGGTARAVTDEEVVKAIDKAQEYLIGLQGANGYWPEQMNYGASTECGHSEMVLYTLAYIGVHPNRDVMTKGLDGIINRNLDYTYAVSMRAMAYAQIQKKLASPKKELVRAALKNDVLWLVAAQGSHGGWDYKTLSGSNGRYDTSNTQMAILALREAALVGIEIPPIVWQRTQALYFKLQKTDGAWNYGEHSDNIGKDVAGYGSMTAAGLASIFITSDNLDPGRGCPCKGGQSPIARGDLDRRIDSALGWLSGNFTADGNPKAPDGPGWNHLYWLYAVERVGIAAGFKYFGNHNWFKEGMEQLMKTQQPNGSWGNIPETCFATLFLYKGRAPILYNKLQFKSGDKLGDWDNHRRDIANLVGFFEKKKEQAFQWQIVTLNGPVEELHDAPILYITAETPPTFNDEEKKKLRQFTDTGGTILFEASCGNPTVKAWVPGFVKEVWPEYALKGLGPDHGSFMEPYPMKQRPEILGLDDGIRTFLFYAMDDISCPWNTKAFTGKEYLFLWGINLFNYATDQSPLRSRLATREAAATDRFNTPVKAGAKNTLRLARVKYDGPWTAGRNYKSFDLLVTALQSKAGITLKSEQEGVTAADLEDREVAYLATTGAEVKMVDADKQALKAYLGKGGFLLAEGAAGAPAAETSFRKFAGEMGWELKPIDKASPMLTGKLATAVGYDVSKGLAFSRTLRVQRLGRTYAELVGLYQDKKLVGVFSPFDLTFSLTGWQAYARRGYLAEDALAVATNVFVYLSDRPAGE